MIFEVGSNMVEINERLIPAVNIQVDGFPKLVTEPNGAPYHYPIYFEVLFEDGTNWCVETFSTVNDPWVVINGISFGEPDKAYCGTYSIPVLTWDAFLDHYDRQRLSVLA